MWYFVKLFIACAIFVWLMNGGRFPEGKVQSDYCPDGGWACVRE
jgi:hypothetical protein